MRVLHSNASTMRLAKQLALHLLRKKKQKIKNKNNKK